MNEMYDTVLKYLVRAAMTPENRAMRRAQRTAVRGRAKGRAVRPVGQREHAADAGRPLLHLVLHTAKMLEAVLREEFEAHGIHHGQGRVLSVLSTSDGAMTQVELSRRLFMGQPGVTAVVSRLDELGHVRRSTNRGDARAVMVTLTEGGKRAAELVHGVWARVEHRLECGLLECLGDEGPTRARLVLESLRNSMLARDSQHTEAGDA